MFYKQQNYSMWKNCAKEGNDCCLIVVIIALCKTKHSHHLKGQKMVTVFCFALRSLQTADFCVPMNKYSCMDIDLRIRPRMGMRCNKSVKEDQLGTVYPSPYGDKMEHE